MPFCSEKTTESSRMTLLMELIIAEPKSASLVVTMTTSKSSAPSSRLVKVAWGGGIVVTVPSSASAPTMSVTSSPLAWSADKCSPSRHKKVTCSVAASLPPMKPPTPPAPTTSTRNPIVFCIKPADRGWWRLGHAAREAGQP
eukprot:437424-Prymnesium_polylepis.1